MLLEQREKIQSEAFAVKLATYGHDPETYAETVFPEWFTNEGETDLDSLGQYETVIYDLEEDPDIMTPNKMERMLSQFVPQR